MSPRPREESLRRLRLLAPGIFLIVCVEAATSIFARWPHQFAGTGEPDHVPVDFLYFGTLLVAPLPLLLLVAASVVLIRRDDRLGLYATAALTASCAVMAVGSLGEGLAANSPDAPYSLQVGVSALNCLLFLLLVVFGMGAFPWSAPGRR